MDACTTRGNPRPLGADFVGNWLDALRLSLGVLIGAGAVLLIMLVSAPRSAPVQLDQNHMVFNPSVVLDTSQVEDYRPENARPCSSDCGLDD